MVGEVRGWTWALFQYQLGVLKDGCVLPAEDELVSSITQPPVPPEMYAIILSGLPYPTADLRQC